MARRTAVLPCIADAYTDNSTNSTIYTNYGGLNYLIVGQHWSTFMQFDLSQIPVGSVIHSAYLSIYSRNVENSGFMYNRTIMDVWHVNNTTWDESTITLNNAPPNNESNSTIAYPNIPPAAEGQEYQHSVGMARYVDNWVNLGPTQPYWKHGALHLVVHSSSSPLGGDTYFWSRHASPQTRPTITVDFTTPNDAPYAPTVYTPGNGSWNATGSPTVSWSFSDPNAGDTQGAWAVQIIDHNTGVVVRDPGWIGGAASSWAISPPLPDGPYRYRVYTRDQLGAQGPPSWEPVFYVDATVPTGTVQANQLLNLAPGGTFRVNATASDNFSGVSRVRFQTSAPGYGYTSYEGVNDGGGNWHVVVPIANYGNVEGLYLTVVTAYDAVGNNAFIGSVDTNIDRTKPNDPNILASNIKANSMTFTWNAFSDPAPSSFYLKTLLYVRKNGVPGSVDIDSNGSIEDFLTFTDNRTSYTVNNLQENTSYSFVVTHYDRAGNEGNYTWKTIKTNSRPTAQLLNLTGLGYLLNQRPKIRLSGNDTEGSAMNLHIQISNSSTFATTTVDSLAVGGTGWSISNAVGNGIVNTFTPPVDLGIGTKYVRVQAHDGQEWGDWSTAIALVIQSPTFAGAIAVSDTTASKRWIEDLRTKTNAIRQARGLSVAIWTDPVIRDWNDISGGTWIRDVHITELRTALQDVASIFGATLTWTRLSLAGPNRSGQDWLDLRSAAVTL